LLSGSTTSGDDSDENADKNLGKLDVLDLPLLLSCATQDVNQAGSPAEAKPSSGMVAASQAADTKIAICPKTHRR